MRRKTDRGGKGEGLYHGFRCVWKRVKSDGSIKVKAGGSGVEPSCECCVGCGIWELILICVFV